MRLRAAAVFVVSLVLAALINACGGDGASAPSPEGPAPTAQAKRQDATNDQSDEDPPVFLATDLVRERLVLATEARDRFDRGMEGAELVERVGGDGPPAWNLVTLDLGVFALRKSAEALFDLEWLPVWRGSIRETETGTLVFEPGGIPARLRITFQYRDHSWVGVFTALYVVSVSLGCFDSIVLGDPWPSDEEQCVRGTD